MLENPTMTRRFISTVSCCFSRVSAVADVSHAAHIDHYSNGWQNDKFFSAQNYARCSFSLSHNKIIVMEVHKLFTSTFTELDNHLAENRFSVTVMRAKIKMIKLRFWITIIIFVNIQWIWEFIHTLLIFRLRFNLIKTAIHRKIINYRRHNGILCAIGCITIISWTLVLRFIAIDDFKFDLNIHM